MRGCLMLVMLIGCLATSAHAEMIIVAASGESGYAPGDKLAEDAPVTLTEGAKITVLSQSGALQVIAGPFDGTADGAGAVSAEPLSGKSWSAIKTLLGDPDARSEVMGASRGDLTAGYRAPPSIWLVSVDSSGPRCTLPGQLVLWRRSSDADYVVSARSDTARASDLLWAKGEQTLALPASFAKTSGRLVLQMNGSADKQLREFDLKLRPEALSEATPSTLLGWLTEEKCSRQALRLIQRVHASAGIE